MATGSSDIVLLDGGMGQELYHRSRSPATPLWSAQVLSDEPELVEAVHSEFIAAGAKVIILNSYSATPERLAAEGKAELFEPLQASAITVAMAARDKSGQAVRIAGCLPPLVASYRPDLVPDYETCLALYRRIVAAQVEAVDFLLCETLASVAEAKVATQAAVESGKPVWTCLTVDDRDGTKLRSGEPLLKGCEAAIEAGAEAVLVNCSLPEAVDQAVPVLAGLGVPFGAYANGFTSVLELEPGMTVDVLKARSDLGPDVYANHALGWVEAGASIVGGCCEVGPVHIAELAKRLNEAGYRPVADLPGR